MLTADQEKKLITRAQATINDYQTGALEGVMGYKFQTRAFMEVVFLYKNGVDVKNPDLLGKNNKNTFINEAQSEIEKIKEQVRLDIIDMEPQVSGASALGRFTVKAANRKMLEDNEFSSVLDFVPDDAIDYGSGFLKVWKAADGTMKMRDIDPFDITFNQKNFKDGLKIEKLTKKVSWIIENEKYDAGARLKYVSKYPAAEDRNKDIILYQVVEDTRNNKDKIVKQKVSIIDTENEIVVYHEETNEPVVWYFKFDCEKRKGFPDALGVGKYERIFNRLVQSKVNRERMDQVIAIASKLPFQKKMDNERDNWAGKELIKMKTSAIMGYKENPIEVMDTGGVKQVNVINTLLGEIVSSIGSDLNVGDVLQGKTLPSGTSAELGNLLTENSSSVHKEVQKDYAKFLNMVYKTCLNDYLLSVFDSEENLRDYLEANDIKIIEKNVINYMVAQKEIDAAINDEPFDAAIAREQVKREIKGKPLISGSLLDDLRNEVTGIRMYIVGEKVNKAKSVAFIRGLRDAYVGNPALFKDPFYVSILKKEAEFEVGLDPIEIDNLLAELA